MDYTGLIWGALGLAVGGVLKGAIGIGSPLLAIPILAILYNVPVAVALFTLPNLLSNLWQGWIYRSHLLDRDFLLRFTLAGALGAVLGSLLLAWLPGDVLLGVVGMVVFVYIGIRLVHPHWVLALPLARRLSAPAGFVAGVMQGAGGISAPVSVTFISAMRLPRLQFMSTMSVFFVAMALVQIPALWALGILDMERAGLSLAATIPLFGAMPLGAWLARFISQEVFDRIILGLLAVIALRLFYGAFL